jgi:hypothetical protein
MPELSLGFFFPVSGGHPSQGLPPSYGGGYPSHGLPGTGEAPSHPIALPPPGQPGSPQHPIAGVPPETPGSVPIYVVVMTSSGPKVAGPFNVPPEAAPK